jgi:hypothetical protein
VLGRRSLLLGAAVLLAGVPAARPAGSVVASDTTPAVEVHVDDGAARPNPLDEALVPPGLRGGAGPAAQHAKAGIDGLRADGSSGFTPFETGAHDYGAYRFQLVASGSDGDIERMRPVLQVVATQLSQALGITFSVDPGQVSRPVSVGRFPPGWCGGSGGHGCSFFDDRDDSVGVIRVGFSTGSPCGTLVGPGSTQGTVGCGGPESARRDDGGVVHLRGNVWLSPSLGGANAAIAGEVAAHEVGHAVGLDHHAPAYTAIPGGTPVRQLMYPSVHADPSDTGSSYRTGDAHGLWWLHPAQAWFITATYRDFLGRAPDTGGYQFWVEAGAGDVEYVTALATSDEWVGRIVADFYADVFGRAPDPGGFAYWSGRVRAAGVPAVAAQLYGSDEYLARNGGSTTGVVQALYRDLLGRDPAADPGGVAYWVGEAGRRGRVDVALAFFQSEEKRRARVRDLYCTLLDRPPDAAGQAYWAGVILAQGDLALARNLATSFEYHASADEFSLRPPGTPTPPGC